MTTPTLPAELVEDCPFCHHEATFIPGFFFQGERCGEIVQCNNCGATMPRLWGKRSDTAIQRWNTAALSTPSIVAMREALEEALAIIKATDDMWSDDGEGGRVDPIEARSGQVREIWQRMRAALSPKGNEQ